MSRRDISLAGGTYVSLSKVVRAIRETKPRCFSCQRPLVGDDGDLHLSLYDHPSGYLVSGLHQRQWISVHCGNCQYDNSLRSLLAPAGSPLRSLR